MTAKKTFKSATSAKSRLLQVDTTQGKTNDRLIAELIADGVVGNAAMLVTLNRSEFGEVSLSDCAAVLRDKGNAVNRGNMREAEALLCAQASSLNAIYNEMARRAALNMGEYIGAMETYLRLALKAQSQCRSTLEALAEMKNPPVVYARQANISNGPQQVNNGIPADSTLAPAQAEEIENAQSELLKSRGGQYSQAQTMTQ